MEYRIKSLVVGFRLPRWESGLLQSSEAKNKLLNDIVKLYPKQIFVIDSRITLSKSYEDNFGIISYSLTYYYDGNELIKSTRNELMEEFKTGVKRVIGDYLDQKAYHYQEILS